ncbi:MAG: hypothetical protein WC412_00870 [Candidatus Omnitrophota bacterium]|jgi:hypothetical protein
MKSWQKIVVVSCSIITLVSLFSVSSSFATVLAQKKSSRSQATITFSGIYENEKIQVKLPGGNGVSMTYDLGVDLGAEKAVM